jgi:UDP-glucose 4-epimerase
MNLLIPGGAGYIGSHMVKYAQALGHEVVVLDDFSTGYDWAVRDCQVLNVDLLDRDKLAKVLSGLKFDGVIHFAAKSLVGESILKPEVYYRNNVVGTLNLVSEMLKNEVNNLVFSSTAAIFGNPTREKLTEDHPQNPINPYGKSKLMVEGILSDICTTHGFNAVCFRYFNAAGADESGIIGEAHEPETHLIPNILKSISSGRSELKVFGDDYETPDGTCLRDYVHVNDLAQAHLLGLNNLESQPGFSAFNLGNGNGFSVLQVIESCQQVTGAEVRYSLGARRAGDPAALVSDSTLAKDVLGWRPKFGNLNQIIESAWRWHCSL